MTPTPRPQRKAKKLPLDKCVQIGTPYPYFKVQKILQSMGIILMDLKTGTPIDGQVSLPEIGLINSFKPRPVRRSLGFIQPPEPANPIFINADVEAILSYDGVVHADEPIYMIISVVDEKEVKEWTQFAHFIGDSVADKINGKKEATIVFGVTGMCMPDPANPTATKNVMLRKYQG